MNQFKYILMTRSKLLIALALGCVVAIWMISCAKPKEEKKAEEVVAVAKEKPQVKIVHDTIYKCPPKTARPIPAITKFKIGDWVCAWDKITGVVQDISWSETDPNLLQYDLVYSVGMDEGGEPKWGYETFFETTLTAGKCR